MSWVKVTDEAFDDPRLLSLHRGARLLHFEALAWSNRYAADGVIPSHVLRRLTDEPEPETAAAQLVDAGLWRPIDGGWSLAWLLDDQPSAEETRRRREHDARRQARKRRHNAGDHSSCEPTRCHALMSRGDSGRDSGRESTPSRPDPSRPDPTRPVGRDGEETPPAELSESPAAPRNQRRELAKAIREAPPELRPRFLSRFRAEYGHLYGRGESA